MVRYPGFSANLAMLFQDGRQGVFSSAGTIPSSQDVPFLQRFGRARRAGFGAVEISTNELFEYPAEEVFGNQRKVTMFG